MSGTPTKMPTRWKILEIVGVARVVADAARQMQSRPGAYSNSSNLPGTCLDPLNPAAGDAKDDFVAGRVFVLRVLLARPEDRLEDADVLGAVRLAGDQLATFKGRDAVLHIHELMLDDGFA